LGLAIVTGANAGLGKETAACLAKAGLTVVMACRSRERGEAARAEILQRLPDADLVVRELDLASLASVRAFAEGFREAYPRLDLLINNAGIMVPPPARSEDGFEIQMAANYFGHVLLTALLIEHMPDSPQSRVVSLASIAHKNGRIRLDALASAGDYRQSKLACLMFAFELDRRLRRAGRKILSVAAHPGVSLTPLVRHMNPVLIALLRCTVAPLLFHSPARGAEATLLAALGAQVEGGQYFGPQGLMEMRGRPGLARIAPQARDETMARRLWEASEALTGATFAL
jgi:NAD(P)-dependent dehydrogenase (short-subunit alcohol dehydrogenase family)